jgi:aryl sulfotransferase
VTPATVRYRSPEEDSARWVDFRYRPGDIVISTRSKHGTTWMQMICALLIFQTAELPAPLPRLSPWLDWLTAPHDEVLALLEEQQHRRFVKTHTPLDGIPLDPRARYVVVARHPLDAAISLYHQGDNLDRNRIRQLTGGQAGSAEPRPPVHEWLAAWIDRDSGPREDMDGLPGVLWHLSDAWRRRSNPNVVLVHYDDLSADLGAQMRRVARELDITVPDQRWPQLVAAAGFSAMRERGPELAPDPVGVLKDSRAFFRQGRSGEARQLLSDEQLARYYARAAQLASDELLAWLHRDAARSAA